MSNLSVKIDFTIVPTKEPKEIVILDTSNWGVAYTQPSYLSILPPGFSNWVNLNFVKETYTILNSSNLGMSCITQECTDIELQDLDDGIWEFCLKSAYEGLDKKRYYLKDDQLRTEIDKIRISLGLNIKPDSLEVKEINTSEFLLATAHSFARQGLIGDAMRGYNEAEKIINKHKKCKNCI